MAQETLPVTVNNICPKVYETGQYSSTPEAKAAELTALLESLLVYGVYPSVADAASDGVPAGTFVIIDDPETPATEFSVQIVPVTR